MCHTKYIKCYPAITKIINTTIMNCSTILQILLPINQRKKNIVFHHDAASCMFRTLTKCLLKPLKISTKQKLDRLHETLQQVLLAFFQKWFNMNSPLNNKTFNTWRGSSVSQTRVLSAFETKQQLGLAFCAVSLVCGSFLLAFYFLWKVEDAL